MRKKHQECRHETPVRHIFMGNTNMTHQECISWKRIYILMENVHSLYCVILCNMAKCPSIGEFWWKLVVEYDTLYLLLRYFVFTTLFSFLQSFIYTLGITLVKFSRCFIFSFKTIYDNFTSDFMILVFAMLYFLWYFSHFKVVYFLKTFHSFRVLLLSVMFPFSCFFLYYTFEFSGHFPFLYFSRSKSEGEHLPDWSSS